jgi:hypothetical protein
MRAVAKDVLMRNLPTALHSASQAAVPPRGLLENFSANISDALKPRDVSEAALQVLENLKHALHAYGAELHWVEEALVCRRSARALFVGSPVVVDDERPCALRLCTASMSTASATSSRTSGPDSSWPSNLSTASRPGSRSRPSSSGARQAVCSRRRTRRSSITLPRCGSSKV